jgi:hypothetical protein
MRSNGRRLCGASLALGLALGGCSSDHAAHHAAHPAEVEHIDGSELSRVTFTPKAMERVDVQTAPVATEQIRGVDFGVVPYSSLLYDPQGGTWVYTSPEPRTFVRQQVSVDRIDGDKVYLTDGPAAGTVVASVGVAEIYGTEFEVGH